MIDVLGYQIKKELYKSSRSAIYRAIREADNLPVIIKLLNKEYPDERDLTSFRREFELTESMQTEETKKAYGLEKNKNSLLMVLEDTGGESIDRIIPSLSGDLESQLHLAVKITEALSEIHEKDIIHKDINPHNIVWNRNTDELRIIDFGIATEIQRENTRLTGSEKLLGTLNYISPEQTGRMNRPLDYRTDLYSLGITLYQIFTGVLPFQWEDEGEIVYCHIAKNPPPPEQFSPQIPRIISEIILKLMEKNAEDRYQMALGLKQDLEYCIKSLQPKGEIPSFLIGQNDFSGLFLIPDRLYGRDKELHHLMERFEEVAEGGSNLVWVNGSPGVGKSSLIQELTKSIAQRKGFFVSGKFDQLENKQPLSGLIQALKGLVHHLLAQPEDRLNFWKEKIGRALPQNGRIIVELLPEAELLMENLPPLADLPPLESQNRFNITLRNFITLFARKDSPLVIFLDDLQWSDLTTLSLIQYIHGKSRTPYLQLIGAYRENEVGEGHPLRVLMDEISQDTTLLPLLSLEEKDVHQMLSETFHAPGKKTKPLAELVYRKTKGNPFFTHKLLNSLYEKGAFHFHTGKMEWTWDFQQIENLEISDNVLTLLEENIKQLPQDTLDLLKTASCIGNNFDLNHLTLILQRSPFEAGKALWPAVESDLIYPLDQNYRLIQLNEADISLSSIEISFSFQHDRIQQVLNSMIPEMEKKSIHLEIGRGYSLYLRNRENSEFIFKLVDHLNIGRSLIKDRAERINLKDLNYAAGRKAMKSTAYSNAVNYFDQGIGSLTEKEWQDHPEEFYDLALLKGEALFLKGDLEGAESLCNKIFPLASNHFRKAQVYILKARILEFQANFPASIEELRQGLQLFGVRLPSDEEEIGIKLGEYIGLMMQGLAKTSIEGIVDLPEMTDQEKIVIMQLFTQVVPPALQSNPKLFVLSDLMMLQQTLEYGTSPLSCKCIADCGLILISSVGDYDKGYRLGLAAFDLIRKYQAQSVMSAVYFVFPFISFWKTHYQESLDYYDMSYRIGLETGDIQHAAYAISHRIHLYMQLGIPLDQCRKEMDNALVFLEEAQTAMPHFLAQLISYFIDKYRNPKEPENTGLFEKSDEQWIQKIQSAHNLAYLYRFFMYNTSYCFIHGDYENADRWCQQAEQLLIAAQADFPRAEQFLFQSLILLRKWGHLSEEEKTAGMEMVLKNKERLQLWADLCPSNFKHKLLLLTAEMAVIQNDSLENILNLYQEALVSIAANEFSHMKALIHENIGNFWLARGEEINGKAYIREAYFLYARWGGIRKTLQMEKNYPPVYFSNRLSTGTQQKTIGTQNLPENSIDTASILKSSRAISSEIKIENLLRKLMYIIIENACAQQGALLLVQNEKEGLFVEAWKSMDSKSIEVTYSIPYRESPYLCPEIIQFVYHSGKSVVLTHASREGEFRNAPYIIDKKVKSLLCIPIHYQNTLKGIIYLENNLTEGVFTEEREKTIRILSSQAAISIENARLVEFLEEKVKERTLQLKMANDRFKELSLLDPLTDLHNRRYIQEFVTEMSLNFIKNKIRLLHSEDQRDLSLKNKVLGVFIIDLDHFKDVNDTYGHMAGDQVLVTVARLLKGMIRADDFLVRWGGEEFLIILNNTDAEYLKSFAQKVMKAFRETPLPVSEDKNLIKTCSIGYTMMPMNRENPEMLNLEQTINISDYALYLAKERGRDRAFFLRAKEKQQISEECKEYLIRLSKDSPLKEDLVEIQSVQ